MTETLSLLALSEKIEKAFKSLIKSGRPDIRDDQNNDLIPQLYVDLYDHNYILRQVMDDNHVLLKGRKGTGKSTIFLQAENIIKGEKGKISIYINLQACYEEIKTANADNSNDLTKYKTYYNFFSEVLSSMEKNISKVLNDDELDELFKDIKNGEYIDVDFQKSLQINTCYGVEKNFGIGTSLEGGIPKASFNINSKNKCQTTTTNELNELRVFSINSILKKIKQVLSKHKINKVYLFLDDFSELSYDNQKMIVDSLVSPIVASYNDVFAIKLAAYPYRIYLGNIDSSKIIAHSLDFYDVFEQSAQNYGHVEDSAKQYIKRTIEKRLEVFTEGQLNIQDIFDLEKETLDIYIKTLFYAASGIPRSLGYILTYCYLSSISQGKAITISNINNAAKKYYVVNILPDFYNDTRFKQSFYDDKDILDQIAQKNLVDELINKAKKTKREIIDLYGKKDCKQIFTDTLEKYKKSTLYWFPTSHFFVEKDIESILQTLELYFIVSKFNEGSSRDPGKKVSYFGLNYGLCLENGIDYGRPEFRRTYDYWRQDEFNFTNFIPTVLSEIEVPICSNCGYKYTDDNEYKMSERFGKCLPCGKVGSIVKVNKFEEKFKDKIQSWKETSLPDIYIDILRILYNYKDQTLTAYEIGLELGKHHLTITKAMNKLKTYNYISYKKDIKRHYKIEENAMSKFFSD